MTLSSGLPTEWRQEKQWLREIGILEEVKAENLAEYDHGDIVAPCSDGDRVLDMVGHHCLFHLAHRAAPRPHIIALAGGALRIQRDPDFGGAVMLADIALTLSKVKKDIRCVSLYAHAPCGLYSLSPHDGLHDLLHSRDRLREYLAKQDIPNVRLYCFYHVDLGGDAPDNQRFRTYRVRCPETARFPSHPPHPIEC